LQAAGQALAADQSPSSLLTPIGGRLAALSAAELQCRIGNKKEI